MAVKAKKIFSVFFRDKPAMMLVNLLNQEGDVYASNLAKQVDCTYSHVVKILQEMQKADLIEFKRRGRLKILKLTKKGDEVARAIDKIRATI